jgi:translin
MELENIFETINKSFSKKNKAREEALLHSRAAIQYSGNSIRAIHRSEFEKALGLIQKAKDEIEKTRELLEKDFPDIYYAGFAQNAEKEVVEAVSTYRLIHGESLPGVDELNVGYAQYLNGIGEAIGELRRHILDLIRHEEVEKAEKLLNDMDDIYYLMASVDYPDAITWGLRRTTDIARSIMEKTRGDLTTAIRQRKLRDTMKELNRRLENEN